MPASIIDAQTALTVHAHLAAALSLAEGKGDTLLVALVSEALDCAVARLPEASMPTQLADR